MMSSDETSSSVDRSARKGISPYGDRKAALLLNVAIIGCGLGGLAAAYCMAQAGHQVTVFEAAPQISEVGAGIQVGPNLTRLLIRWGVGDELKKVAVTPGAITFRRWNTGETVGWTGWANMEKEYKAPYYHIHRADFLNLMFGLALPLMTLRVNSRVTAVDPSKPSLTLASGEIFHADVILGADGVKSVVREVVIGQPDQPTPTGDAAYRALVPTSELMKDPDLRPLIDTPEMVGWMGPGRHIMAYSVRAKKEYNLVMCHPDDGSVESWTAEGSADKMRADFKGWEPRIQKLLALVPTTLNWKLMARDPLKTWIHKDGKVALLGDAAHPMLPYRAQGSAMAVEDAAVLGNLFSRISDSSQITPLLHAYEHLRYDRATATQESSRLNQKIFHLPDGPEQEARDKGMRQAMVWSRKEALGEPVPEIDESKDNPNQWADKAKSVVQFMYDPDAEVDRWWSVEGEKTLGGAGRTARL